MPAGCLRLTRVLILRERLAAVKRFPEGCPCSRPQNAWLVRAGGLKWLTGTA